MLLEYSRAYFENRKNYLADHFCNGKSIDKLLEAIEFPNSSKASRRTDNRVLEGLSQLSSFMSYFSL